MPRYVAFLRAINVGGHTVKMDRLRALVEELKFASVETFIASGNVLFDSTLRQTDGLEARIEMHLAAALGYEVPAFVRAIGELDAVLLSHPFPKVTLEGDSLWVGFLKAEPSAVEAQRFIALGTDDDIFHVHARHTYWFRHGRMSDSKVTGKVLERAIGSPFTFRNVTTVGKLAARAR